MKTAQKDTIKDITNDSQVNSHFQYCWSPASLTLTSFLLISIFKYHKNNSKYQQLTTSKITKESKQKSRRGTASNIILGAGDGLGDGGLELVCGRQTLALGSVLVHQTEQLQTSKTKRIKHKRKAKRSAGIEGHVATMLKSQSLKSVIYP